MRIDNPLSFTAARRVFAEHQNACAAAIVCVLALACFAAALTGPFILDDWPLIGNNPAVHSLGRWRDWVTTDFWSVDLAQAQLGERLRYFRPLVLASYAVDWQLGSGAPLWLHASNLILHTLVALLAFVTLRRWTGDTFAAAAGALIFGLHPTKAESVAWISGRPDLLLTLGVLIASWGMARRLRRESGGWALEALGTVIAYASKEHALVLPAFACIECWVVMGRPALDRTTLRPFAGAAWPQALLAAAYLAARAWLMPLRQFEISGLSPSVHLGLVLETLGRIHGLAAWPADLSMLQSMIRTGPDGPRLAWGYVALGGAAVGLVVSGVLTFRRQRPAFALALALWLGMLLPVSNLVWSGLPNLTSPRFLYLPVLALAWGAAELARARPRSAWLWAAAALLPLLLASRSVARSLDFRSVTAFWNRELSTHPDLCMGYVFAVDYARREGRPRQALGLAARGFGVTAQDYSHAAQRSTLILKAVQLATALTRDEQRAELMAIDTFVSQLMGSEAATLRLATVALEIPPGAQIKSQLAPRYPELLLVQADIATRLGDDRRGLTLAERAVESCPRCTPEWESAALIALRAGDRARARAWLSGPRARAWSEVPSRLRALADTIGDMDARIASAAGLERTRLTVQRLSLLGLSGRAYAALAPHGSELEASHEGRQILAEIAARAGAEEHARGLLASSSPAEIERLMARWTTPPGSRDAPLDTHDDLEFEATLKRLLIGAT